MDVNWQHIAELALMSLVSFSGSWGAIRARLANVEQRAESAHQRIDSMLVSPKRSPTS